MFSLRTTLVRGGLVVALATGWLALIGTTAAAAPGQEPAKAPISVGAPHAAYAGHGDVPQLPPGLQRGA